MEPLEVVTETEAREHLNFRQTQQPGGDAEFRRIITAAVLRVRRHLGRDPDPGNELEKLACLTALDDFWETQRPTVAGRQPYGGSVAGADDDGITSRAPLREKLTELLGPPVDDAAESSVGAFPLPSPWPDPIGLSPGWR